MPDPVTTPRLARPRPSRGARRRIRPPGSRLMSPLARPLLAAGAAGGAVLLGGCATAAEPAPPPVTVTATPEPASTPAPTATGEERTAPVIVEATATAPDGATLDLRVIVSEGVPSSSADPAILDAFGAQCDPAFISPAELEQGGWVIVAVEIEATAGDGVWPDGTALSLVTAPTEGVGDGALATVSGGLDAPADPAGEVGPCLVPRTLDGAGDGAFVLALRLPPEADPADAWTRESYGVQVVDGTGVALTGCAVDVLPGAGGTAADGMRPEDTGTACLLRQAT